MAQFSNRVEISRGGPQGPQGPTGPAGPAGGPTGPTGSTGPAGAFETTFPVSPFVGQVWADLESGKFYLYVDDGDSQQWVQIATAPQGPTGPTGTNGDATLYTPAVDANWDVVPTTLAAALDEIASRLRTLENL